MSRYYPDPDQIVPVSRDPFARHDVVRVLIDEDERGECAFCGQVARFNYGIWPDGVYRATEISDTQFCGIGCWRDYHG